jgi:hypothetical protein
LPIIGCGEIIVLKNLYFDVGFLNPIKKKNQKEPKQAADIAKVQPSAPQQQYVQPQAVQREQPKPAESLAWQPGSTLPHVSHKLLKEHLVHAQNEIKDLSPAAKDSYALPKVKPVDEPARISPKKDEAAENSGKAVKKPGIPAADVALPKQGYAAASKVRYAPVSGQGYQAAAKDGVNAENISHRSDRRTSLSDTFFMRLQDHITKEDMLMNGHVPKQILYKDLLHEMHGFWESQKFDIHQSMLDSAVKSDVARKVRELHDLEVEWQNLQLENDRIKDLLATKELMIESHVKQLKRSFKKLHMTQDAPADRHFVLKDGTRIKNLQELSDSLRMMQESVFYYHANNQRNDFSNWVREVMALHDLADNMEAAGSRQETLACIEDWRNAV